MSKLKFTLQKVQKLNVWSLLSGMAITAGINSLFIWNSYSSRFEAEAACNQSNLYCHHDKETKQILGLDYQKSIDFKLGWPVMNRYKYR